jgi:hypothetical protein
MVIKRLFYWWLLVVIRVNYHRLLMAIGATILLMAIDGYYINVYC